mgnify:CR=1 FL=1
MKLRAMVALLLAGGLFAYYPFLRYNTRNAPFVGVASKFDLATLPNKTVYFYISETGPQTLLPGDSPAAIYSQVRAAARVWNDVDTSDLRIAFGGVRQAGCVAGATPGIDVSFEDLPPGVLSRGGPVLVDDDGAVAQQTFIPILRSVVELPRNFTTLASPCPCPSWSDYFFTSVVHEFGHALGLQHTFTSSVMSILRTRGTTKAKPLGADDIAGLSSLYPTRAFAANFGVISGRITSGGAGVAYASVVAVSPAGAAVSTLTHPDGTYRIEGVPAGTYVVYAQNLPPDGDIVQALDADRRLVPLSPVFDTTFFPAGREHDPLTGGYTVGSGDLTGHGAAIILAARTIYQEVTSPMFSWLAQRLITRNIDALNRGDIRPLLQFEHPDIHFSFPGDNSWAGEIHDRDGHARWLQRLVDVGLQHEVEQVVAQGPPWNTTLCLRGIDHLDTEDGRVYENRYVIWGRMAWGRITAYEVYEDTQASAALDEYLESRAAVTA